MSTPTSFPTATPTLTPTSVPTPSPSPSVLHVVMDGSAPVWQGPLLTGLFVLTAALITAGLAYLSLRASDRRKLKREDLRQWDRDLKDAYAAIIKLTREVGHTLARARSEPDEAQKLQDVTAEAMQGVYQQSLLLDLHARRRVNDAVTDVSNVLVSIFQRAFLAAREEETNLKWARESLSELNRQEDRLRDEIRRALRMPTK